MLKMGKISLVMNAPAKGKWQFSTFPNFEKSKMKSDLLMLFSKIGHQIDYFGKIKINSKFRPCRQILEIYRDWLLSLSEDKPHREIQDKVLVLLGPLRALYENLSPLLETLIKEGSVSFDKAAVFNLLSCTKNAILMAGDTSAQISTVRCEPVLMKLNTMPTSLGKEEFPDAQCHLFGDGFEQRLKTCFETADTISNASYLLYDSYKC